MDSDRDLDEESHNTSQKRRRLSVDEKYQICKRLEGGESTVSIARSFDIKKTTIWRIKRDANSVKNFVENIRVGDHRVRKTIKAPQNQLLEHGILAWFIRRQLAKEQISGTLLADKALELNKKIGGAREFAASSGWLHRFKLRHQITFQNLIGGTLLGESLAALDSRCVVKEKIAKENYDCNNIYHLEETELAWRNIPKCEAVCSKNRLTIVMCTNSSGSHRLSLLVLGKDECSPPNASVLYRKRKVRGNSQVIDWFINHFIPSVKDFQTKSGKKGKVLLVIDRATTEAAVEQLNAVNEDFHIILLPYKAAAVTQPLDRCVVMNFKCAYRMQLLKYLMSRKGDSQDINEVCNSFQLEDGLTILSEVWDSLSGEEIRSSWNSLWYIGDTDFVEDLFFSPHVSDFLQVVRSIPGCENCTVTDMYVWLNVDNGRDLLLEDDPNIADDDVRSTPHRDPLSGADSEELCCDPLVDEESTEETDRTVEQSQNTGGVIAPTSCMSPKKKRTRLSLEEKLQICKSVEEGESTQSLLKRFNVNQSTMWRIIHNAPNIKKFVENASDKRVRKTIKQPQNRRLEHAVLAWFIRKQLMKESISWSILCDTALKLNKRLGGNSDFAASNGWQSGFKLRHHIKLQNLQGEELSTEAEAAQNFQVHVKTLISDECYIKENIYHIEETALAWKMLPRCETSGTNIRLSLIMCTNSTGTHRLPILVLGNEDCEAEVESIIYRKQLTSNQSHITDWYTSCLIPSIREFQAKTGNKGKALLVMDRTTSEKNVEELNTVDEDFHVILTPYKIASSIHPLDRNLVLSIKCCYRMNLLQQIQSHDEGEGSQSIIEAYENFELDDGLQLLSESWDTISDEDIETAWKKLWYICDADIVEDIQFSPSVSEFVDTLHNIPGHDDCSKFDVYVWLNIDNDLSFLHELVEEKGNSCTVDSARNTKSQQPDLNLTSPMREEESYAVVGSSVTSVKKGLRGALNVDNMRKKIARELGTIDNDTPGSCTESSYEYYEAIQNSLCGVKVEPSDDEPSEVDGTSAEAATSDLSISQDCEWAKWAASDVPHSERARSSDTSGRERENNVNKGERGGTSLHPSDGDALEACKLLSKWLQKQNIKEDISFGNLHAVILSRLND